MNTFQRIYPFFNLVMYLFQNWRSNTVIHKILEVILKSTRTNVHSPYFLTCFISIIALSTLSLISNIITFWQDFSKGFPWAKIYLSLPETFLCFQDSTFHSFYLRHKNPKRFEWVRSVVWLCYLFFCALLKFRWLFGE